MAIQLSKVKAAVRDSLADTTGKPVSMSDVDRIVNERTASVRAESARGAYAMAKMADLPEVYRSQLPATEDEDALKAAEQEIRSAYREDMRVHGPFHAGYVQVTGDPGEHGPGMDSTYKALGRAQALAEQQRAAGEVPVKAETPPPQPDMSNWSSQQMIAAGLASNSSAQPTKSTPARFVGTTAMSAQDLIAAGLRGGH